MSEAPRTMSTETEMCEQLYDAVSHNVEEDLQDQMQELRREINELRVVVYALLAAGFIAISWRAG
jgi:signal transduction histidine kinase